MHPVMTFVRPAMVKAVSLMHLQIKYKVPKLSSFFAGKLNDHRLD
jgi:hypothetical protein